MEGFLVLLAICVLILVAAFVTNVIRVDQALQEEINKAQEEVSHLKFEIEILKNQTAEKSAKYAHDKELGENRDNYCDRRINEALRDIDDLKEEVNKIKASTPRFDELPFSVM